MRITLCFALLLVLAVPVVAQEVEPAGVADKAVNFVAIAGDVIAIDRVKKTETGKALYFAIITRDSRGYSMPVFCIAHGEEAQKILRYGRLLSCRIITLHVYLEGCLQWQNYHYFTSIQIRRGFIVSASKIQVLSVNYALYSTSNADR